MPDKGRPKRTAKPAKTPAAARSADPALSSSPTGCAGWVWWKASADPHAREKPKEDYYNERLVPKVVRVEFDKMRQRYRSGQLRNGANIKFIGDGIFEFKYSHIGNTPFRFLFMRWGKWAVALDVFKKTTPETPKQLAVQRRKAWLAAFGKEPPPE